jgi:hypothetical protein
MPANGTYRSLVVATFYVPSPESLAALRAALKAHGVKMKFRSRAPE